MRAKTKGFQHGPACTVWQSLTELKQNLNRIDGSCILSLRCPLQLHSYSVGQDEEKGYVHQCECVCVCVCVQVSVCSQCMIVADTHTDAVVMECSSQKITQNISLAFKGITCYLVHNVWRICGFITDKTIDTSPCTKKRTENVFTRNSLLM